MDNSRSLTLLLQVFFKSYVKALLRRLKSRDLHILPYTTSLSHYKWLYVYNTPNSEWESERWVVFFLLYYFHQAITDNPGHNMMRQMLHPLIIFNIVFVHPNKKSPNITLKKVKGVVKNTSCLIIYGQGCLKYKIGDLYHNLWILFGFLKVLCMWNRRLQSSSWTGKRLKSVTV